MSSPAAVPKPPPMTTTSGSKIATSDETPAPSDFPIVASAVTASASPACASVYEPMRVAVGPVQVSGRTIAGTPRSQRLEVSAAAAGALGPTLLNDDVTHLGPCPQETPVDDGTASDPGSQREHDEVRRATADPELPLGERGRAGVVLDPDRKREAIPCALHEIDVRERKVDRVDDLASPALEVRGNPVADGDDTVVDSFSTAASSAPSSSVSDASGVSISCVVEDRAVLLDEAREDLRPPHVEPDGEGSTHGAGYLSAPGSRHPSRVASLVAAP